MRVHAALVPSGDPRDRQLYRRISWYTASLLSCPGPPERMSLARSWQVASCTSCSSEQVRVTVVTNRWVYLPEASPRTKPSDTDEPSAPATSSRTCESGNCSTFRDCTDTRRSSGYTVRHSCPPRSSDFTTSRPSAWHAARRRVRRASAQSNAVGAQQQGSACTREPLAQGPCAPRLPSQAGARSAGENTGPRPAPGQPCPNAEVTSSEAGEGTGAHGCPGLGGCKQLAPHFSAVEFA